MSDGKVSKKEIEKVVGLANLTVSDNQKERFVGQVEEVLEFVGQLDEVEVEGVKETNQVTGLTGGLREDVVEKERCLSQEEVLGQARETYKGFVVVPAILEERDL